MVKKSIFQHFRAEERAFVEKVLDDLDRVEANYVPLLTNFLNPRQLTIYQSLASKQNLVTYSSNDFLTKEYARLIIAPDYYVLDLADFELCLIELEYASKFNQIRHSQVLGTLINQLGIKRSVFGDILIEDKRIQLILDAKLAPYFQQKVRKIASCPVKLVEKSFDQKIDVEVVATRQDILVSALRLDQILAGVLKISRSQANRLILTNKVKLNYQSITKPSEQVQVGDLLSVRGFGRFCLLEIRGMTKSGKHKLSIEKIGKI